MALDGPTATITAALIAATVVFVSLGWNVLYRLGKLDQGTEDMEKALDKLATATERRFERFEETMEKVSSDMERRFERSEETMRVEHEVTRAEIRRVVEAIASHTHDADGTTIFRIPPG